MAKPSITGGVTGERVEYRVPAQVFTHLKITNAKAVCFPDHAQLARVAQAHAGAAARSADWMTQNAARYGVAQSRVEQKVKDRARKADVMEAFAQVLERDLGKLRAGGVEGPIPVCLFRGTGKFADESRERRRAVAIHERFHADVRRAEVRLGARIDKGDCAKTARSLWRERLGDVGDRALAESALARWGDALEELLARTEEVRKSCLRSDVQCAETRARFAAQPTDRWGSRNASFVNDVADAVQREFGSAMGFVTQALRACASGGARGRP